MLIGLGQIVKESVPEVRTSQSKALRCLLVVCSFLVGNRLLPGQGIRVRFGRVDRVPQHNKNTHRMSSTYWSLADRVQFLCWS